MSDFSDLLGLAPECPAPVAEESSPIPSSSPGRVPRQQEDVVAYPSVLEVRGGASGSTSRPGGSTSAAPGPSTSTVRRYVVRCEGRWRVRSSASLNSKVLGTIASGTVVLGREAKGDISAQDLPVHGQGTDVPRCRPAKGQEIATTVRTLWVEAIRFETNDPLGVSEIKRDTASGQGGALYCLRRNALGFGLYEDGVESIDGPLLMLPEKLSTELRADAQHAAAEKVEDVSLTWKLLSAAESMGSVFGSLWTSPAEEAGIQEDIKPHLKRRPDDVFETRQREQLKKAAAGLKKATERIIAKGGGGADDLTAGMPKELARRFARLRKTLAAAANLEPLVVSAGRAHAAAQAAQAQSAPASTLPRGDSFCEQAQDDVSDQVPAVGEGGVADLEQFCELCTRLERSGGWPELPADLKQEVVGFSTRHMTELEDYAYRMHKAEIKARGDGVMAGRGTTSGLHSPGSGAGSPGAVAPPAAPAAFDDSLLGDLTSSSPPTAGPKPAAAAAPLAGAFLLPPPPPPKNGVQSLI